MSDLTTDCLLAVTGLLPDKITRRERSAANTLPDTFAKRARAWWTADDPKPFKEPTTPDMDKLFDRLATAPTQPEVQAWLANDDDLDIVDDLLISLKKARQYLVDKWPRIQIATFGGTRLMPLAMDDAAEVASLWAVLNDPLRVLDEMDSWTLTPSQAEAFRANHPALYEHYRTELQAAAALRVGKDQNWIPTEAQEIALAILTGQPSGVASYESAGSSEHAPPPEKDLGASAAETQLDKSAKPKSAK